MLVHTGNPHYEHTYILPSIVLPIEQVGLTVMLSLPKGYKGNHGS